MHLRQKWTHSWKLREPEAGMLYYSSTKNTSVCVRCDVEYDCGVHISS